jgi:hypothetical protein
VFSTNIMQLVLWAYGDQDGYVGTTAKCLEYRNYCKDKEQNMSSTSNIKVTNFVVPGVTRKSPKGLRASHRREKGFFCAYLVITPKLEEIINCRLYFGGVRVYACLWIHQHTSKEGPQESSTAAIMRYTCGSDYAGGGGYHKASAAAGGAITEAGFCLDQSINGVGDQAIEDALKAIATFLGEPEAKVFKAHE